MCVEVIQIASDCRVNKKSMLIYCCIRGRVRSDATAVYVSKERYKLVVSSDTKAPLGNTEENILASVTAHNPILFAHTKPFS